MKKCEICGVGINQYRPTQKWCAGCRREGNRIRQKEYASGRADVLREYKAAHYMANKELYKARAKASYERNRERRASLARAWVEANREKVKAYRRARYAEKKDEIKANQRARESVDPEGTRKKRAEWRRRNRDKINARKRADFQRNKAKIRARQREKDRLWSAEMDRIVDEYFLKPSNGRDVVQRLQEAGRWPKGRRKQFQLLRRGMWLITNAVRDPEVLQSLKRESRRARSSPGS